MIDDFRPPIVTDKDRKWALAQKPSWCRFGDLDDDLDDAGDNGEWLDREPRQRSGCEPPNWSMFVAEEIEKFEAHYAGEYRTAHEWSSIWRKGWWPKVSARKRFPKSAPKEYHPFFRQGSPEFARALEVASAHERAMWTRFGVAQFTPDDKRLDHVLGIPKHLTERSKAMTGDKS